MLINCKKEPISVLFLNVDKNKIKECRVKGFALRTNVESKQKLFVEKAKK